MVKMEALLRSDRDTFRMLMMTEAMRPIGAQLCGASPQLAGKAARILEDLGFDVIDLNCGCPVDKVTRDGSGSALLLKPLLIGDILSNMVAAVKIPVTVKIRAGWDATHLVHKDLVRIAELAGASALTIHGRTQAQGYTGLANRTWIAEAKRQATTIPIIGNGDIYSAHDARSMLQETGCDGVLVARGTLGQPWIAEECRRLEKGEAPLSPEEKRSVFLEHVKNTLSLLPEDRALLDLKRVVSMYTTKSKESRALRDALGRATTLQEMLELIYR